MDNTQKIQNLNQVILALNNIDVKGKNNLANLAGSISILEDIVNEIAKEIHEQEEQIEINK